MPTPEATLKPGGTIGLASFNASPTQSLDRAMELLDVVVAHAVAGLSLGPLAAAVGLAKPTAHRLLTGLRNAGLVDYDSANRLFFPAFKLCSLGQAAGERFNVIQMAGASLKKLADETGDTIYLAVRSGDFAVCVSRTLGDFPIKTITLNAGDTRPLGLGSNSMVLLSALPDEECARVIARHREALRDYPAFDPISLRSYIARTRSDGYAFNEGLMMSEMSAVAMGIRGPTGSIDASISVAAITSRMQSPRRESIVKLLRTEVQAIEALMRANMGTRRSA